MTISAHSNALRSLALGCVLILSAGAATAASPAQSTVAAPTGVLTLAELETRLTEQGISIREIELKEAVAEVEGHDTAGRKVELLIDRRSGEILSRKLDD